MTNRKNNKGGKVRYAKGGFLSTLEDVGKTILDVPLSVVGATDVINQDDYNGEAFKSIDKVTKVAAPIAGSIAATALTAGAAAPILGAATTAATAVNAGTALSAARQIGSSLNPTNVPELEQKSVSTTPIAPSVMNTPTYSFADGGNIGNINASSDLTRYNGNTHENGGIPIGPNAEVETGETRNKDYVSSAQMIIPGTKVSFAQMSKRIENKYKRRPDDAMSKKVKERELDDLRESQELVKFEADAKAMQKLASKNPEVFAQITGQQANPATQQLMPPNVGNMPTPTEVPIPGQEQMLKKGGKLIKNKSTTLSGVKTDGSSPGVTMEKIRASRHYVDVLVSTVHGRYQRSRKYPKGGYLPDGDNPLITDAPMVTAGVDGQQVYTSQDMEDALQSTSPFEQYSRRAQMGILADPYGYSKTKPNKLTSYYSTAIHNIPGGTDPNTGIATPAYLDENAVINNQASPVTASTPINNIPGGTDPRTIATPAYLDENAPIANLTNSAVPIVAGSPLAATKTTGTPNAIQNTQPAPQKSMLNNIGAAVANVATDALASNTASPTNNWFPKEAKIGMGIQAATELGRGVVLAARNKYMPVEYTTVTPVKFDRMTADEPLAQSKSAYAGVNKAVASNSTNAGQYLSNRIASGGAEGMQRAGIVEQVNNQNAAIQAQEATQNAQIAQYNAELKLKTGEINQQEYDSITQAWNDYLLGVSNHGAGITRDMLGYKTQNIALNNLDTAHYDFYLDANGKIVQTPKANFAGDLGAALGYTQTTVEENGVGRNGNTATITTNTRTQGRTN